MSKRESKLLLGDILDSIKKLNPTRLDIHSSLLFWIQEQQIPTHELLLCEVDWVCLFE